ncbi:hypothetical protein [Noviherbaspirillum soli]|uniref:hypothetical protein n=1 Tax=Noviherbaspirillum soli TaxID=1064518 RepID=UPI00188A434B|nr:hypothetical protein [Noviherbaspirillum soli]
MEKGKEKPEAAPCALRKCIQESRQARGIASSQQCNKETFGEKTTERQSAKWTARPYHAGISI